MVRRLPNVRRWYERALFRLSLSVTIGCISAALVGGSFWVRGLVGWNIGSASLLLLHLWIILSSDSATSRARAGARDPGNTAAWGLLLLACLFSLVASIIMLGHEQEAENKLMFFCLWAVLSAWFLTHTTFTLRYAHLYYRDRGVCGGLTFPGNEPPDDLDFAYFAFTIGMCFQVSDVTIEDRYIRRTALVHAILSFFFNTAILALSLNLVLSHVGNLKL